MLRDRVQRSHADIESVLRLAAGLWAQGDRVGARTLLDEARAAVPEESVLLAALGLVAEGFGDYDGARRHYLAFLGATGASSVSGAMLDRISAIRGETAAPLVQQLLDSGRTLEHATDGRLVLAVPSFEAPDGDADMVRLAAAATELLVVELRDRGLDVLDWELTDAAKESIGPTADGGIPARAIADLLGAGAVIWGTVEGRPQGRVVFHLQTLRLLPSNARVGDGSFETTLAEYGDDRARLTHLVYEMWLGAIPGTTSADSFADPPLVEVQALLALGEGLLAYRDGDHAQAEVLYRRARAAAPTFPAILNRLAQTEKVLSLRRSTAMPLAEDLLTLARHQAIAAYLLSEAASQGALAGSNRWGVSEVFGLDRLGAQVFADFVFTSGGNEE